MIVMKFGGTSVGDAEGIKRIFNITKKNLQKKPVLVVSAHAGVTDNLINLAKNAVQGDVNLENLKKRHFKIVEDLGMKPDFQEKLFQELDILLKGISLVKELTPRTLDYVVSFGERLSVRTVTNYFEKNGIPAEAIDAYDLGLITDSNFGSAAPLPESDAIISWNLKNTAKLPIITGFIGKNKEGEITTLGRNGSDYSATIIGSAVESEEVQIWTDVDGVMTADPRIVKNSKSVDFMSFVEACELSYFGGRVLHPHTLIPAIRKGIPVRVINTFKPEHKGTVIIKEIQSNQIVKSIACKKDIYLINIISTRMFMHHGFMQKVFDIFGRHKIVIDMIATSEVSVSLTTDRDDYLEEAIRELSSFSEIHVEGGKAVVCIVGEKIKEHPEVIAEVFFSTKQIKIVPQMISMSTNRVNIGFIVNNEEADDVVRSLHKSFFE